MENPNNMEESSMYKPADPPQGAPYKMHYFGQRVYAEDFTDDQVFHESMRHFHNQTLHSSGIVGGLSVSISDVDQGNFTISPGSAVDPQGREIIVLEEVTGSGLDSTKENYLYIRYQEWMGQEIKDVASTWTGILRKDYSSPPPKGYPSTGYPYIQYSYQVWIEGSGDREEGILLAAIRKGSGGWQIDTSGRVYAASKLPRDACFDNLSAKKLSFDTPMDHTHKGSGAFIAYTQEDTAAKLILGCDHSADAIGFYQNGAEQLVIKNGNVGIGIDNPSCKMEINGGIKASKLQVVGNLLLSSKGELRGMVTEDTLVNTMKIGCNEDGSYGAAIQAVQPKGHYSDGTRLDLCTIRGGNDDVFVPRLSVLAMSGNVGIGTENPTVRLEVKGQIKDETGYVMPKGAIILWSGNRGDIPQGWVLCDGTKGTPDLRDRFIVGAGGKYQTRETGGQNSVVLSIEQMPSHQHRGTASSSNYKVAYQEDIRHRDKGGDVGFVLLDFQSCKYGTMVVSPFASENSGSDAAHENRPPYLALCYIMKL